MKKIVFFVVLLLLLIAVPVTVYFVGTQQELRSKAAPATTLTFSPASITKAVDDQFSVNVQIDTGANSVTAVKLDIAFDATKLEAMSITNGEFAPKISASGTVAPGTASITVAAASTAQPINGTGTIAILRMRGKAGTGGPISMTFGSTTFVSSLNETTNALTTTQPAVITITGATSGIGGASALPTETPIPTTFVTPTPTLIVTPTLEPEATTAAQEETAMGGAMPVSGSPLPAVLSLIVAIGFLAVGGIIRFAAL
jgi:hypothetical protein